MKVNAKKIANKHFNDIAGATTRTTRKSGPPKFMRILKRLYNKSARRKAERFTMREQLALLD